MGIIIDGETTATIRAERAPLVLRKENWADSWELDLSLVPVRAELHTAAAGGGRLIFRSKYGPATALPGEASMTARTPLDLAGWWVKVELVSADGFVEVWTGRVEKQTRDIQGASSGRSGEQTWIAYGADTILAKTHIYQSVWGRAGLRQILDRPTRFNVRDGDGSGELIGNRSSSTVSDPNNYSHYIFGGTDVWTNYQMLVYLVEEFLLGDDRPWWTIGGQADILKSMTQRIALPTPFTLREAFAQIISPRYGLDYALRATPSGFVIDVFSLAAESVSFGGYDFPKNPRNIKFDSQYSADLTCKVEYSHSQKYDKLRVVGSRIKVMASLEVAELEKKWTSALETAYRAGTGNSGDDPEEHDQARADDKFRHVFQAVGAPDDWALRYGAANVFMDFDGSVDTGSHGGYQLHERRTLPKLLLREGWDYTSATPVNDNPSGLEADFLPPLVIIKDLNSNRYVQVDKLSELRTDLPNVAVAALDHEWGVLLKSKPNHLFAKNHWSGANGSNFDATTDGLDYEDLKVTIAFEGDLRLVAGYDDPDGSELGLTKIIYEPKAEYWYLSPSTIVGVGTSGALLQSPSSAVVLRDDSPVLAALLAGAIYRYIKPRLHVSVGWRGLDDWASLVGAILDYVDDGEERQEIAAPITSVYWDFIKGTMKVLAGHAKR